MKSVSQIVLSATAATSTMTLFSYIVSEKEDQNFREPKLLAEFLDRSFKTSEDISLPLGWAGHYLVGAGFATGYRLLLQYGQANPSAKNGLLFGVVAGVTGVLAWEILFKNHNNPPKTHKKGFYVQLIAAHLIFGLTLSVFKIKQGL